MGFFRGGSVFILGILLFVSFLALNSFFILESSLKYDNVKEMLDELHKRKIDLADEVFVLNVGGYIGESTRSEIEYAQEHQKKIRYLEPVGVIKKGERENEI